jgi:Spy/CpxP family protein refolding chaperone
MKRRVIVLAMTMATALLAQPPGGGRANAVPPTPQEMIQHHVERLTHYLTLTSDQQSQVTNILTADINNLTTLRDGMKAHREAVLAAIKSNSGIAAAVTALSNAQAQIETIRANEAAHIYAILTADQKTKIGDAVNMLAGGGGPGGPGGPGGFGGPRGHRGGGGPR